MSAFFNQGFFVREPAWHGLGEVLDEYPGREEAMRLAGHDFQVVELPIYQGFRRPDGTEYFKPIMGWKRLSKDGNGHTLNVVRDSYGVVQNDVLWDIVDTIVDLPNVKYETAGVLKDGAVLWVLAWLDEPVVIPGDDSPLLPFLCASTTHDGSGSCQVRSTSVRVVCANTIAASEAEGKRLGTEYTFRHTSKVAERIEEAKETIKGIRIQHQEYVELARELATIPVTASQRELFLTEFIPMPPEALISDRVANNVDEARAAVRALFVGRTVPEAHRFTAYGLHLAGIEYLDHLRGYRNRETYFWRSMLRTEPAKAKLHKLIREVVAA